MSRVWSLEIRGYKSIRELPIFRLNNLNVLIGANGVGKSNFISLFRMINEMYERRLQLFVQLQGGPDAILYYGREVTNEVDVKIYFEGNGYFFNLVPTADNRLIFNQEVSWLAGRDFHSQTRAVLGVGHEESRLKSASDLYSPYVRDGVANWHVYHFHDTSDKSRIKQKHANNNNLFLKPDAANLAAFLHRLRGEAVDSFNKIVEIIRVVAPFFKDFVYRPGDPDYIELEWFHREQPDTPLKAHMLSDGTLRFICLATLLLQPEYLRPDTIIIDEPELGLHPYAISVLADLFREASSVGTQLIVSTQSVELVNELTPEDVIVVDQEEGASTFRRLEAESLKDWLKDYSLGELWKKNILGGRP